MVIVSSKLKTLVLLFGALMAGGAAAQAVPGCGSSYSGGIPPTDYRYATAAELHVVERRHFTSDVERLRQGTSSSVLASDIAYTLRKFPNHYRALKAMGDWSLKTGMNPPVGGEVSVECWYQRAIQFVPEDAMVRVFYATYLLQNDENEAAIEQLEAARAGAEENANVHYNLGLAYARLGEYEKALDSAHIAYRLGFPLPGLKNILQRQGAWQDP